MTLTTLDGPTVGLNEPLLIAIARSRAQGRSAYRIAAQAKVHPSELSRWIHGRRKPSAAQAARVAKALGCAVADIFPTDESSPAAIPGSTKTDAGGPREAYT
jgi:transcriptional regulator with XRE-family HTH domain